MEHRAHDILGKIQPRTWTIYILFFISLSGYSQSNPLEKDEWQDFFTNRKYEAKALEITDETFWAVDSSYTYFSTYPLLLVYVDGSAKEIDFQYEGIHQLIYKKSSILMENYDRIPKDGVAFMVFEGLLLRNSDMESIVSGDYYIVCKKGPLSLYREYYTSPILPDHIESVLTPFYLSEPVENFFLGSFHKKASKLLEDYPELSQNIRNKTPGYTGEEPDFLNIASEYNQWVKGKDSYKYDDHTKMFWQNPAYLNSGKD